MNKPACLSLVFSVVLVLIVNTQLWGQSLDPTHWYRIRTPNVDIIFKGNISREAQRMANTLEHLYGPVHQSLGIKPTRITLLLRNQRARSTGFLELMPRRIEFSAFPPQDYNLLGTNDWLSLLAVHELRHVAQYTKLKQNFNQLAYWLGGDYFLMGISSLNIPKWFWEGDAVGTETALTSSGRGRMSSFSCLYRANLLERGGFGYYQQFRGSFKDQIPDEYKMGYYLTTYLRRKYGPGILADIFHRTTSPRLFHTTIAKITGKSLLQIYEEANQELKTLWQEQLSNLRLTPAIRLNPRNNTDYTDYAFPQLGKDGEVIVLKSGINMVPQFVSIVSKQLLRKIRTHGSIDVRIGFSAAQNKIVWVEEIRDVIRENRSYSVIQHYDIQTKRLKTLTKKSRYSAAALSPDATQIVAFESDEGYNHQLVILDAKTGKILQRLPNPDNHYYLTPQWSETGKKIVVVKSVKSKVTIALIDIATGTTQDLLPYTTEHLACPTMQGRYVFYHSNYSGIDNIYAIDLATCQRYQVTSRKYGAYNPTISADGRWLIFNDFTKDGMDVVKMPLDPTQWVPLAQVEDRSVDYHTPLVQQEGNINVLQHVPNHTYPIKRYYPQRYWLNVHSWFGVKDIKWNNEDPKYPTGTLQQVLFNVLQSKDLLGTTELEIDYLQDFKNKSGTASAKLTCRAWYPIISLTGELQGNYQKGLTYHRMLSLQLKAPWTTQHGQYTHEYSLDTTGKLNHDACGIRYTQAYEGRVSRKYKASPRDICHSWQQQLTVTYQHVLYGGTGPYLEAPAAISALLYFPGFARHHAFCLRGGYEYHILTGDAVQCRNQLRASKPGVFSVIEKLWRKMPYASVMYAFPLGYPDWSVGYWLYLKRFHAKVGYHFQCESRIYDKEYVAVCPPHSTHGGHNTFRRFGKQKIKNATQCKNEVYMGLLADCHLLNFLNLPQLSLGVRYNYKIEQRKGTLLFDLSMGGM
ncbi:MAG: hypothetical protein MUC61_01345 [Amoebophilaceae bacterium]|jgi:hypothetical protein|nr:hypothetical protein [Amoebophilaceae bacterium]